MENPEEILHSLEEFAKMKPKDIPRELEEYLRFVAKTGDPIYQWSAIKSLFREKLINVITEFYESCTSMEIPPCPNVDIFNYDLMKNFILEKLDTFSSAPFTLQRICELLTSPHKEYTRIDKYMRALEKNILVVSTMEPGGRRTENGEGIMNGIESDHDHVPEPGNEINVVEIDHSLPCPQIEKCPIEEPNFFQKYVDENIYIKDQEFTNSEYGIETSIDTYSSEKVTSEASTSSQEIVCVQYVSIGPLPSGNLQHQTESSKEDVSVTITAVNIERVTETHVETGNAEPKTERKEASSQKLEDQKSENEPDDKMSIQLSDPTPSENNEPDSCEVTPEMPTEDLSTTIKDKDISNNENIEIKTNQNQSENISSDSTITCSEIASDQSEVSSNLTSNECNESKATTEDSIEMSKNETSCQRSDETSMDAVDSTTTSDVKEENPIMEGELASQVKNEDVLAPESSVENEDYKSDAVSSTICKDTNNLEIPMQQDEVPSESSEHSTITDDSQQEPEQVSSAVKDKEVPMELDAGADEKQTVMQEPESSEPTV